MARSDGRDYFQRTSAFWIGSVTFGISLYTVSPVTHFLLKPCTVVLLCYEVSKVHLSRAERLERSVRARSQRRVHCHVIVCCSSYLRPFTPLSADWTHARAKSTGLDNVDCPLPELLLPWRPNHSLSLLLLLLCLHLGTNTQ